MSKPKRQVFDTPSPPPELTGNPPPFALNNTSFIGIIISCVYVCIVFLFDYIM